MKALVPVLTRAGLRAVFNADRDGLQAKISHIAFGDSAYTPTGEEEALGNECARVPIAGGSWVGDFTIHMIALLDGDADFWIRECAIVLSDGTLLAIYSDPATPLGYKKDGVSSVMAFDLTLTQLPQSAVTVQAGNVDMTLFFAVEFAQLATGIIDNQRRHLAQADEIDELRRRIASLEYRTV